MPLVCAMKKNKQKTKPCQNKKRKNKSMGVCYEAIVDGKKRWAYISANTYRANKNTCLSLHDYNTGSLIDVLTINTNNRIGDDRICVLYDPMDDYNIKHALQDNGVVDWFYTPISVLQFPELKEYADQNKFYMVCVGVLSYSFMEDIRFGTKAKTLREY